MSTFDKDAFFTALAPKTFPVVDDVSIPTEFKDLFVKLKMKQLTVEEVDLTRAALNISNDKESFGIQLVVACLVDENGDKVLSTDDLAKIKSSRNDLIEKLVGTALEINGLLKAKDEKNSVTTQSVDSASVLPSA